jgi:hypothetical protein
LEQERRWVGFGVRSDGTDSVSREAVEGGWVQVGICGWVGRGWVGLWLEVEEAGPA